MFGYDDIYLRYQFLYNTFIVIFMEKSRELEMDDRVERDCEDDKRRCEVSVISNM